MQGQISEHPLAELIREIVASALSGALRLSQSPAKVAVYFAAGRLVLGSSNLRAHRLREVVKRHGLTDAHVAEFSLNASDHELAAALVQRGLLKPETLAAMRLNQVGDVLRLALLWTEGEWEFDPRVRLADDTRVEIDITRLLRECARHLPAGFVAARLMCGKGRYSRTNNTETNLTPAEALILARASDPVTLGELSGNGAEDAHRAIYALILSGLLQCNDWPVALATEAVTSATKTQRAPRAEAPAIEPDKIDQEADIEALFARLNRVTDHYGVLDLGHRAGTDEIKTAYRALALQFHPDRFHQSAAELRTKVESAFARIAQAYETLSDPSLRTDYDSRMQSEVKPNQLAVPVTRENGTKAPAPVGANSAERSFQHGLDELRLNRHEQAIRFLGEAAMSSPREARYRAHYGYALIRQPNTRRLAESELLAALALEPDNAAFRVMLAELYKQLGLLRRAEGELGRALVADPNNEAARSMLSNLKSKR